MNYLPGSGSLCVWWLGVQEPMPEDENDVATELPQRFGIAPLPKHCLQQIGDRYVSTRVSQSLGYYGINTVDELCRYPAEVLLTARGFAETSLREVEEKLAAIGRKLPKQRNRD